jgi:murein DD-endopeptidase MepM/ murein hydrolase activator NlpD
LHQGIDVAGADDSAVLATMSGTVVLAEENGSAGYEVRITGGVDPVYTVRFAHLHSYLEVSKDQMITRGTIVGYQDSTGFVLGSSASHVHYEIWENGIPVDPAPFIPVPSGTDGKGASCRF